MYRMLGLALLAVICGPQFVRAEFLQFASNLSGAVEAPPNSSPGRGYAQIDMDTIAHTMRVQVTFSGLLGNTTASHVHAPTAVPGVGTSGIATELPSFTGFPLGVTSGTYDHTFDTTLTATWNTTFLNNNGGTALTAEAAFIKAMRDGKAYLNVHTNVVPAGEIRGFVTPVPAPPGVILMGTGAVMMVLGSSIRAMRRRVAVA